MSPDNNTLPMPQARRASLLLAAASAMGGSVGPIVVGTAGLVGLSMLPPEQAGLATVPVSAYVLGSAVASVPAALSMRKLGRRVGFMTGTGIGASGALLAAVAVNAGAFWLFVCTMIWLGTASAFAQQYRFAAADAAEPSFKARAIAWVMLGGLFTGVIGPQVSIHARRLTPYAPFAGPFVVQAGLYVIAAVLLSRLVVPAPIPRVAGVGHGRSVWSVLSQPRFLIAVLVSVASFVPMTFVMTATPLAMVAHHHSQSSAQYGIQWHVIAMYAPSFLTGRLINRFGKSTMAAFGMFIMAAAVMLALSGTGLMHFWGALVLLGVGWNFAFISATTMVANLYLPEEAFRVQALNEFLLFSLVALASFSSGGVLARSGWHTVNVLVYPILAVGIALVVTQARLERRAHVT
ncbi:MAG: MFS transporter [Gemmatimonadaceae bacterium]|nr:MFS transporter [Gemmatimonadaceae bacterium]